MAFAPLMPLIVSIAIFLSGIVFLIARSFTRPRISGPSCGNCHYDIRGLFSDICPECGSRLSEVGVLHPGSPRPLGRIGCIFVWTAMLAPISLIGSSFILQSIPKPWGIFGQRVFSAPASALYQSVTISAAHIFRNAADARAPVLTVMLQRNDGSTSTMQADFKSMQCAFTSKDGQTVRHPLSFDRSEPEGTVMEWYVASGIADNIQTRRESAKIADALWSHYAAGRANQRTQNMSADYFAGVPGRSMSTKSSGYTSSGVFHRTSDVINTGAANDPWPARFVAAGWIALWLLGVGLILFLKRQRAPVDASMAAATYTSPPRDESIHVAESTFQTDSNPA